MKILLESAGSGGKVNLIRCLKADNKNYLIGTDNDYNSVTKSLFNSFYRTPVYHDSCFIEMLIDICKREECHHIYPLATHSLNFFSEQIDTFRKNNINLLISNSKAINIANNKLHLYNFLKEYFPDNVPEFYEISSIDGFRKAIYNLGYPSHDICVRLPMSTGGAGLRVITSKKEKLLKNYLYNNSHLTYISLEFFSQFINSGESFPKLLVQKFLSGEEWDIDCLSNKEKCILAFTRRNNQMLGGASLQCDIIENKELIELSIKVIDKIGLNYINQLTFIYDEKKVPKLIEINPRPPLSIDASLLSGINLPQIMINNVHNIDFHLPDFKYGYKYGRLFSGHSWG